MQVRTTHTVVRGGFTLMEVLVVVAILVVLAGTGGFIYLRYLEESKQDAARIGVEGISTAVNAYYLRHKEYPPELLVLTQPLEGKPAYLEERALLDPWDRPYIYEPQNLHPNTGKPHIYSQGPNPGNPASVISNWGPVGQ